MAATSQFSLEILANLQQQFFNNFLSNQQNQTSFTSSANDAVSALQCFPNQLINSSLTYNQQNSFLPQSLDANSNGLVENDLPKAIKSAFKFLPSENLMTFNGKDKNCSNKNKNTIINPNIFGKQSPSIATVASTSSNDVSSVKNLNDERPKRRNRLGGTSVKTAEVWRFFTQLPPPEQAATCSLCQKIIKATNSSTTGMIRHLRSCHAPEYEILQEARRYNELLKNLKNAGSTELEALDILNKWGIYPNNKNKVLNSNSTVKTSTPSIVNQHTVESIIKTSQQSKTYERIESFLNAWKKCQENNLTKNLTVNNDENKNNLFDKLKILLPQQKENTQSLKTNFEQTNVQTLLKNTNNDEDVKENVSVFYENKKNLKRSLNKKNLSLKSEVDNDVPLQKIKKFDEDEQNSNLNETTFMSSVSSNFDETEIFSENFLPKLNTSKIFTSTPIINNNGILKKETNLQEEEQINQLIALMLVIDGNQSASLIDQQGFRFFVNTLLPKYNLPPSDDFRLKIIPETCSKLHLNISNLCGQIITNNPFGCNTFSITSNNDIKENNKQNSNQFENCSSSTIENSSQDSEEIETNLHSSPKSTKNNQKILENQTNSNNSIKELVRNSIQSAQNISQSFLYSIEVDSELNNNNTESLNSNDNLQLFLKNKQNFIKTNNDFEEAKNLRNIDFGSETNSLTFSNHSNCSSTEEVDGNNNMDEKK